MNPIVELKDGTLFDIRAIYYISNLFDSHLDNPYYEVHFMGGKNVLIYEKGYPRAQLVKRWREWANGLKPEEKQSSYRKIEL